MKYIKRLAKRGMIPRRLANVKRMPMFAACKLADATKKNWKIDFKKTCIRYGDDKPGLGTSCDHLISHEPRLMSQVTGRLSHVKYCGVAVFTNHFSNVIFPHLITSTSMEETMNEKIVYERFATDHGVKVLHYRGDNMTYDEKAFTDSCVGQQQKFDFCGVGAHHQNGISEAKNKILTYGARTILLHAKRMWPKVIKPRLLPYAVLFTAKRHNELALDKNGDAPLKKFSGIKQELMCSDWHTWGCPIFVLAAENQSGLTGTPKWEPRARMGVYLGHSPAHAGNAALVLNLITGHISP